MWFQRYRGTCYSTNINQTQIIQDNTKNNTKCRSVKRLYTETVQFDWYYNILNLGSVTSSFMTMNKNILGIKDTSYYQYKHCPNHRPDKSKVIPEIIMLNINKDMCHFVSQVLFSVLFWMKVSHWTVTKIALFFLG